MLCEHSSFKCPPHPIPILPWFFLSAPACVEATTCPVASETTDHREKRSKLNYCTLPMGYSWPLPWGTPGPSHGVLLPLPWGTPGPSHWVLPALPIGYSWPSMGYSWPGTPDRSHEVLLAMVEVGQFPSKFHTLPVQFLPCAANVSDQ